MGSPEQENIEIDFLINIPQEIRNAVKLLIEKLTEHVSPDSLRRILVVPDNKVAETVNIIIREATSKKGSYFPNSEFPANAVSVPVVNGDKLNCYIVIGDGLIQRLSLSNIYVNNVVSAILEELLHVWHYSVVWRRRGFINYTENECDACSIGLYTIASRMHDEYLVNRLKLQILSTIPLVKLNPDDELSTTGIQYGGDIVALMNNAFIEMRNIIEQVTTKKIPISVAWEELQNWIYRGILEPLARDSAFRADTTEKLKTKQIASQSSYYRDYFDDYWVSILHNLERTIISDFTETEDALDVIVEQLKQFLETIGVTLSIIDKSTCYVLFTPGLLV